MLSDDLVHNSILYRQNSKQVKAPFLVPIKDTIGGLPFDNGKLFYSNNVTPSKATGNSSRKSIRIIKPETIKRANNDAFMAASIGDLDWLKQTLKISADRVFDKNGFATIHLASIHGRLNIIKYLIEERQFDIEMRSAHGWRPIHLCISNQTGNRAVDCLKYFITNGADINAKNNDGTCPLHMAATEGQVECLKLLIDAKADITATDLREQTALDLAKLWGHRACAKLITSAMWHFEKKLQFKQDSVEKKQRVQDILKEIELAHITFYQNKDESERNFERWLMNQGFESEQKSSDNKLSIEYNKSSLEEDSNRKNPTLPNIKYSDETTKTSKQSVEFVDTSKEDFSLLNIEPSTNFKNQSKKSILKQKEEMKIHTKPWSTSTRLAKSEYTTNLNDFYPRDPYTFLPKNIDLVYVNKELKGMTLEQVKEFMNKKLTNQSDNEKNSNERPVYYKPKNILDAQTKVKTNEEERRTDFTGLSLYNDLNTFPFREAKKYIIDSNKAPSSTYGSYYNTSGTLKMIKKQLSKSENKVPAKDDKLEVVEKIYGKDLSDFMKDNRHGVMSQKYEKVFIC